MKSVSSNVELRKALAIALVIALVLGTGFMSMIDEPVGEPLDENQGMSYTADIGGTTGALDSISGGDVSSAEETPADNSADNEDALETLNHVIGDPCECDEADCEDCYPLLCEACDDDCEICASGLNDSEGRVNEDAGDGDVINPLSTDETVLINAANVFDVADSAQFSSALMLIADGGVINITDSFTYTSPIFFESISVELNLGANTLTIELDQHFGGALGSTISLRDGATLNVTGPGKLDIIRDSGRAFQVLDSSVMIGGGVIVETTFNWATSFGTILFVDNGTATLTGQNKIEGRIQAINGANVTFGGNITGWIMAEGEGTVVSITGNVSSYSQVIDGAALIVNGTVSGSIWGGGEGTVVTINGGASSWVQSTDGATVTVNGNITDGTVSAWGATITVNGNITGNATYGVHAGGNSTVTINGNISLDKPGSIGVGFGGVEGNSTVIVNGTISAVTFIQIITYEDNGDYSVPRITTITADQYDTVVVRGGQSYRQYITDVGSLLVRTGAIVTPALTESSVTAAISTNEPLVLTGTDTTISAEVLQAIKDSEGTLNIILPNGVHISISAAGIGPNAQPINLNIELTPTNVAVGQVPANSLIIAPDTHGEFGFTINIHIPHAQLVAAGIGSGNLNLYYISAGGTVTNLGAVQRQSDGSVIISISSASQYYLWSPPSVLPGRSPQTGDEISLAISIIMLSLGTLGIIGWTVYFVKLKRAAKQQ